jgi:antitoxin component of MazEF toxin-antitoxin module
MSEDLGITIPMFIVKQLRLQAGDKLDWSLEARKNEITVVIRMAESKKKK